MHLFEGIAEVTGHLIKRAGVQAKGKRTMTVHITNGTSKTLRLVGEPFVRWGDCHVPFESLGPDETGSVLFSTAEVVERSAMHGGAVELSVGDETIFVGMSNPVFRQASFVIQYKGGKGPSNPKDFWHSMPRKFLGRVGDESCVESQASVAHVRDVVYDENYSNSPCGVDVHLTDACGEEEEELQSLLDLNAPGFTGLINACGRQSSARMGHAVFLSEFSAVRGMFLHASLQDRAFALDLLIHAFLLNGSLDIPRDALGATMQRWEKKLRPAALSAANQLPEYDRYKVLDAAGLREYTNAGMSLCRAATHHSVRALRSIVASLKELGNWPPALDSTAVPGEGAVLGVAHGPKAPTSTLALKKAFRRSSESNIEDAVESLAMSRMISLPTAVPDDARSEALHAALEKVCAVMQDDVAYENGAEEAFTQLKHGLQRIVAPKVGEDSNELLVQSLESAPCDAGVVWAYLVQIAGKRRSVQRLIADMAKMLLQSPRWRAALRANPAVRDAPVPTVVHDALQQASEDDSTMGLEPRGGDHVATQDVPLQDLVRHCMTTVADHGIHRLVFQNRFAKQLLKEHRKSTAHDAVRHYQSWIPLAQRRFFAAPSGSLPELRFESFGLDIFCNVAGDEFAQQLKDSLGERSPPYKSITTNSKSGEFFFLSGDQKFLIKTISSKEAMILQQMLPEYQAHLRACPSSLLVRFAALVRLEAPGMPSRFFTVMKNVFEGAPKLHDTFDLKGSLYSRKKKSGETTGKDQDWIDSGQRLSLKPAIRAHLCDVHERDAEFLLSHMVMDYSLLVGVHRASESEEPQAARAARSQCDSSGPFIDDAGNLFYIGVIDFLIQYGFRKRTENILHVVKGHADDASCVPPDQYAERQVHFVRGTILEDVPAQEDYGTAGLLIVDLVSASNLLACDTSGTSDPYVCVTLGLVSRRTPVIDMCLAPRWDSTLYLPVNQSHVAKDVELCVWDRDEVKALRGSDDFLGKITVAMKDIMEGKHAEQRDAPLREVTQGSLVYRIRFWAAPKRR